MIFQLLQVLGKRRAAICMLGMLQLSKGDTKPWQCLATQRTSLVVTPA